MYELGLAHAMRRPEKVLVFRSDDAPLLFDVSGIRVQRYAPDGEAAAARSQVVDPIADAIRYTALADQLSIERTVEELDPLGIALLVGVGGFPLAPELANKKELGRNTQWLPVIHRLMALRVIRTKLEVALSPSSDKHASLDDLSVLQLTDLGIEPMFHVLENTGIWSAFGSRVPKIEEQRQERLRRRSRTLNKPL